MGKSNSESKATEKTLLKRTDQDGSAYEEPRFEKVDAATGTDRTVKSAYAVVVFCYWFFASISHQITLNFLLASVVLIVFVPWMLLWVLVLLKSPNIYYIKVPTARIEDWCPVSIPVQYELQKNKPVTTISTLSGIRGTLLNIHLRTTTAIMGIATMISVQVDIAHRKSTLWKFETNADVVPVLQLFMISGLFLTGFYELSSFDKVHFAIHHVGVTFMFVGSTSIGFLTSWSTFSSVLLMLEVLLTMMWVYFSATTKRRSDKLEYVTAQSRKCVASELLLFTVIPMVIMLTIHGTGPNQGNIFASPWISEQQQQCNV